MAKNYILQFGGTLFTGLTPAFTVFKVVPGGGNTTAPGITEIPTNSGLYYFSYEPLTSIAFNIDGGAALSTVSRYITGSLDPIQAVDERVTELGASLNALSASFEAFSATFTANVDSGTTILALIGTTASSFGSTAINPDTIFGYLKRMQEFNEGDSSFTKTSGVWNIYARGNAVGTSTQLASKIITDSGSVVTKV